MAAHSTSPSTSVRVKPDQLVAAAWHAIPDPVLTFDARLNVVFLNNAAAQVLKAYDLPANGAGLCRNIKLLDANTRRELTREESPVGRALSGESVEWTAYAVKVAGTDICYWIQCSAQPLRMPNGRIEGGLFVFRDVTAQRTRESRLDAPDELRDFIYHSNVAAVVHSTLDGQLLECNDALLRMLGYSSIEELLPLRTTQIYWDPSDRDRLIERLRVTHEVRESEVRLRRRDNSLCWAMINMRLLDPRPGEAGTLLTTLVDITERKLGEDTLRQSQDRFTAFMRHLPGVAFIKDLTGRYIYYNEASLPQFGKRPEEVIGKTDQEVWPTEDASKYRENDAKVVATGKPVEFIEPVAHTDGPHMWQIYKFPIMDEGRIAFVGGIGIDVTERRVLEDQLTQARKMEALGRLAGGVAHDFNNLLTVISGYGQLSLESLGTAPTERMTVYLQEILNSARRAAAMTGQLLAFSRRQSVQPKILDLGDLLRNVERLLRRMIGEHVDLTVRTPDEGCLIRADAHQMEQVLMNLAVNARDAMPLGGALEIKCSRVAQPIERPGRQPLEVLLEVHDNGIGMDESVKAHIFEPFFTSKDKGKGTGLGLSTVYGVVSQGGGEIQVDSAPGQGTEFRLYFPLAKGTSEETGSLHQDAAPVGLETVLLVEDEPGVRTLAETVLKKLGYKVLVADSGEAALEIYNKSGGSVDVVLTDVIMPQMSGGDLAHKLRDINPRLKILFMSGYTDDMIAGHGVLAGETQLIQKPFTAEALGKKLRNVLDS